MLEALTDPLLQALRAPLLAHERIYWAYLLAAGLIALGAYQDTGEGRGLRGFLRYLFPRDVWWHRSARVDYAFFLVDAVLFALLVVPWLGGAAAGRALGERLAGALVARGAADVGPSWLLPLALAVGLAVALDLALWLVHWAQHRVPLLWEFHKVHHSAEVLTPITVYRMHPVDTALNMLLTGLFAGALLGAAGWALGGEARPLTVAGLDVLTFLFYVVGYNLRHSHVWVDWGPALSHVLVSPAQHQVHHSVDPRHWDKNMGFMLAVWDWLAGTLYVPRGREALRYGLAAEPGGAGDAGHTSVAALYVRPFLGLGGALRRTSRAQLACVVVAVGALVAATRVEPAAPAARRVALEELTWPEVRAAVRAGATTVIVPTGGTEQNGPHMVLGKHNRVVEHTARRVAERLGDALVAPVLAYVPEGDVDPPSGHMRFPGTISVPPAVFAAVLEHTARSLRRHGFTTICLLGDSAWNQEAQAEVAARLTTEWAADGVQVLHLGDYYENNGQERWLAAEGEAQDAIGFHAGIRDTSELLAVHPAGVRRDLARRGALDDGSGVDGDPTRASAARGWHLLELKVDAAVKQVRAARARKE